MFKNILLLIDFSEVTNALLEHGKSIGAKFGAKCWLIHVASPDPDFVGYDTGPQYIRDSRAEVLKEEHRKLLDYKKDFAEAGLDCEALLVQGPIMKTVDDEIEKLNIDLVVLGSHGRSMIYELLVGSVCEHLLKHAKVPLHIIPAK
jgi:nucleotide-binding universal stress UspA family protein